MLGPGFHVGFLLRRPRLLLEALRLYLATRSRRGLAPSAHYLRWRSQTAYGGVAPIDRHDLEDFLAWRANLRRTAGWRGGR